MKKLLIAAALAAAGVAQAAPPATIVIPGERIVPESLTSSKDGSVIFGSVGARTIWRAKPGSAMAEAWIKPDTDGMASSFGVFADDKSNTLYVCSNSLGAPPAGGAPVPGSLYLFDLKTGASKAHYPLPGAGAFCNDIAVDAKGNAYVTDTNNMQVGQLKKGAKEITTWAGADGAFGPKGGIVDGISILGDRLFVNALGTSKLFGVEIGKDGKAGKAVEIKLDAPIERPDGMRSFGKNSLLVIEGGGPGRLSKVTVSGDTGKRVVIKEGYPDGPVGVTVVGTTAYVVEGQLSLIRGAPSNPPAPAKPFKATAVEVGKP
jgi:streptogramin lyase